MLTIDKIIFSKTEPPTINVLWAKPIGNGFAFYLFDGGRWKPMNIINDMGTSNTADDKIADISNIEQIVEQQVTQQLINYDSSVGDTHNAPSSDNNEYPDVALFDIE